MFSIYISIVKGLVSQGRQQSSITAMTMPDNNEKNININIIKTLCLAEEIRIKTIKHGTSLGETVDSR